VAQRGSPRRERTVLSEKGTPQGGVISPLLANIYLHEVLDKWFEQEAKPRLQGQCFLVRFADDFVIGCELESDAQRLLAVLPKRFRTLRPDDPSDEDEARKVQQAKTE